MTKGRENIPGARLLPIDAEVVAKEKDAVLSCDKEIADISTPLQCIGEENKFECVQKAGVCGSCLVRFFGICKIKIKDGDFLKDEVKRPEGPSARSHHLV